MRQNDTHQASQQALKTSLNAAGPLIVSEVNPRYFTVASDAEQKAIYLTGSHIWNNFMTEWVQEQIAVITRRRWILMPTSDFSRNIIITSFAFGVGNISNLKRRGAAFIFA